MQRSRTFLPGVICGSSFFKTSPTACPAEVYFVMLLSCQDWNVSLDAGDPRIVAQPFLLDFGLLGGSNGLLEIDSGRSFG